MNHPLRVFLLRVALAALVTAAPASALAADFAAAVRALADPNVTAVTQAISDIAASGHERGLDVLNALEERKLAVDSQGRVLVKEESGYVDAVTGEPQKPQGQVSSILVSNVIRRALGPALAQMRLMSKDREVRHQAATELAKSPEEGAIEAMRRALQREQDTEIRDLLRLGLARVDLHSKDFNRRIAAIEAMGDASDPALQPQLSKLLEKNKDGSFAEPDERLRVAAKSALNSLERKQIVAGAFANFFYGLSLGSVLLLAALGLAITFGLMRVINMAHGEMLMIGAYSTFVVQNFFQEHLPEQLDAYLVVAVPVAFLICMAVGIALERTVIRFLYGRPLETLLATWGLSLVLIQTVRTIFGAQNVTVANPSWLSGGWELMPTIVLPYSRIVVIAFTVVVVSFVWLLLQKTPLGLKVRAVTQNREMAASLGIPTKRVDAWTFGLGSGVAGLGGVALSQLGNVGPELGQQYIVDCFMVVVLGGVGNIIGTIAGALGLGLVNKFVEPLSGAVLGKIIILVLVILFIQKRPQGIFALRGRAAEA